MRRLSRFTGALAAMAATALSAFGCVGIVGDITFDRPEGTGGSTSSSSSATGTGGGPASSSSTGTGGGSGGGPASSSSTGTGGGACASAMCDPAATCDDSSGTAVCTCPPGDKDVNGNGTLCTDPCMPNPCQGHSTCAKNAGEAVCTCAVGWIGAACDTCVYVVDAAAAGAGTGASWADAFTTVQPALTAASGQVQNSGAATCDVWVKQGTYYAYVSADTDSFELPASVGLYGGFAGGETMRGAAAPAANKTTLSGHESAGNASAVEHVVRVDDVVGAVVDGFTIQGGNANGSDEDANGGGILLYAQAAAGVTVSRCEITENSATYGGGIGMAGPVINVTVTDCNVHDNTATLNGGGMACGGTCQVTGTTFRANTANTGGGLYAGGLLVASSDSFVDNAASVDGGGICLLNQSAGTALSDLIFNGNLATGTGGGLYVSGFREASVSNGVFVGNTASTGGAVVDNAPLGFTCVSCTIAGNQATSQGDGIRWYGSGPTLSNTIAWGNPSPSLPPGEDVFPMVASTATMTYSDVRGYVDAATNTFDANPLFTAVPVFFDRATIALGATNSVMVSSGGSFHVGDVIEIGGDGIGRTVSSSVSNTVTFAPALNAAAAAGTKVWDWGAAIAPLDLGLQAGSPCIGAGDAASATPMDINGLARNNPPDVGAYEN